MPPAAADWQYTRWGMGIDQAIRASGNALHPPTPEEQNRYGVNDTAPSLVGTHDMGSFHFVAVLYFNGSNRSLSEVYLQLQDYGHSRALLAALRGLYGEPLGETRSNLGETVRWRDDKHRNEIHMYDMSPISRMKLIYSPLPSNKGL